MIDEGQTDWKIIAIDNTDPMARKLSDISDIDVYMPGLIKTTLDWFRLYKVRCFFSIICSSNSLCPEGTENIPLGSQVSYLRFKN